jgi:hypothetical protein
MVASIYDEATSFLLAEIAEISLPSLCKDLLKANPKSLGEGGQSITM